MFTKPKTTLKRKPSHSEITNVCGDVTNSRLDDKLPLASLWLFLVEVILSETERDVSPHRMRTSNIDN